MRPTSAFGRPTSYLDELPESSIRARVGSKTFFLGIVWECATYCGRLMFFGVLP